MMKAEVLGGETPKTPISEGRSRRISTSPVVYHGPVRLYRNLTSPIREVFSWQTNAREIGPS